MKSKLTTLITAAGTAALLFVAGCSSGNTTTNDGAENQAPVTITSALGEAVLTKTPQRVVTLGWGSTEASLALGVVPVGISKISASSGGSDGMMPWVKEKLGNARPELIPEDGQDLPYEKIAALRPDVIFAVQSGVTADQYKKLTAIAPTVAYPGQVWQTSWQDQTMIVGKALGKEDAARDLVAQTNKRLADIKKSHPEFLGKTLAVTGVTDAASLNYYFDTDPRVQMLKAMGFSSLPAIATLRQQTSPDKFSAPVAWEKVGDYAPNVLVTWYLHNSLKADAEANKVFRGLSAVQNRAYVPLTDPALVYALSSPNVLDIPWQTDRIVPLLSTAAKNAR